MALTDKQMEHPRFDEFADKSNRYLRLLVEDLGMSVEDMEKIDTHSNRMVDDLTAYIMRLDKIANS